MHFNLKEEQDLGRRQVRGRVPRRECKRGKKKASLVCRKEWARTGMAAYMSMVLGQRMWNGT